MEKLVSILTSCYNGAEYIDRFAQSLLNQDYSNCQLVFMNDGSTDNSEELILSYKKQFEQKGFMFEYHVHDNMGVGATYAKGIKYIKGDFLIWLDVDDALPEGSISKRVTYLLSNPDYGLCRTKYNRIEENKPVSIRPLYEIDEDKTNLFENYLLSKSAWFQPGCYMVRMKAFDESNPDRYIYPTRRGQNWQMLLPIMYKYRCGYYPEPLYDYYINTGSLSDETKDTFEIVVNRYDLYEELIIATIKHMNIPTFNKYELQVHYKYLEDKLTAALEYSDKESAKKYFNELKYGKALSSKSYIKYMLVYMPVLYKLIKRYRGI